MKYYKCIFVFIILGILISCLLSNITANCVENATFIDNTKFQEKLKSQVSHLDKILEKLDKAERTVHIPM